MKLPLFCVLLLISSILCAQHIIVLGVAQDGGFPHIGCQNECQLAHKDPSLARYVTSLALVDPQEQKWWLFEATPNLDKQLQYFQELTDKAYPYLPEGIFITHAHIGHYTGLMFLGKEALGAKRVNVYGLPKMINFLSANGPWSQLVELRNILPVTMEDEVSVTLNERTSVMPFRVPHRDEFSETAGFRINTSSTSYLFIPDIDKWQKWNKNIIEEVEQVDKAFVDATFYADGELPNRAMSEIPHPFATETMKLFENTSDKTKAKVHFIHLNHTNPLLWDSSTKQAVKSKGFNLAVQGESYK